jgi:hypothetical protein
MGQYRLDEVKEKAIFDFIISASGFGNDKVIWDKQDVVDPRKAVKPELPYITLNISGGPSLQGTPEMTRVSLDTFEKPFRRAFTVTANVFSNLGWLEMGSQISDAIYLNTKRDILTAAGVSVLDTGDVLDISALLDTKHEGRATVDFFMSDCIVREDVPGEVETTEITGTVGTIETIIPT